MYRPLGLRVCSKEQSESFLFINKNSSRPRNISVKITCLAEFLNKASTDLEIPWPSDMKKITI